MKRNQKKLRSTPVKCRQCGDIIQSEYPGHLVWCSCGEVGVNQTDYYRRVIIGHLDKIDSTPKL